MYNHGKSEISFDIPKYRMLLELFWNPGPEACPANQAV